MIVEALSETREIRLKIGIISQPLNEYQSDRKFECGR